MNDLISLLEALYSALQTPISEKDLLYNSMLPNNRIHLCEYCKYDYPECPAKKDDVIFGNGTGHDNICDCAKFRIKTKRITTETERTAKVVDHKYHIGTSLNIVGEPKICHEYLCDACKKKVLSGDNYCSHCGVKLDWNDNK